MAAGMGEYYSHFSDMTWHFGIKYCVGEKLLSRVSSFNFLRFRNNQPFCFDWNICRLVRLPPPPPSTLLGPDLLLAARGVTSTPAPGGGNPHLLQHKVGSITTDPNIKHSCKAFLYKNPPYLSKV